MNQNRPENGTGISRPRLGRPSAKQAGDIDRRILTAATTIFLEQGFNRASLDHVAVEAHVGKTTLYSRYETKEALFDTVIQHCVCEALQDINPQRVQGTVEDKLQQSGVALAKATLTPFILSIMRITLAENARFPELARKTFHLGFGACVERIADVLVAGEESVAPHLASDLARRFVEMALHPLYYHALFKDDLPLLRERIAVDTAQVAKMLCRDLSDLAVDLAPSKSDGAQTQTP